MKKCLSLILALTMVFAFAGCGSHDKQEDFYAIHERHMVGSGTNENQATLPLTVKYDSSTGPSEAQVSVYLNRDIEGDWELYKKELLNIGDSATFPIPEGAEYRVMAEPMAGQNGCMDFLISTDPGSAVTMTEEDSSSLYDQGLNISSLVSQMASNETYLSTMTASEDVKQALSGAASTDPMAPKAVYEISVSEDALLDALGVENTDGMSEELKASLTAKSYSALAPQINALGGVNNLAASSMCTAGVSFVDPDFSGNALYLYTYEDGAPVMVSFTEGADHAVSAAGSFLLGDGLSTESKEEIETYFSQFGAEVREIQN